MFLVGFVGLPISRQRELKLILHLQIDCIPIFHERMLSAKTDFRSGLLRRWGALDAGIPYTPKAGVLTVQRIFA